MTLAEPPAVQPPNPRPPTAQEAAQIIEEAWKDPDWGTLVWLTMVTGLRRGELCAIRWRHLDLVNGVLHLERRIGQIGADLWEEQSTKTHADRRVVLDPDGTTPRRPESVTQRYRRMCKQVGVRTAIHKLRHYSATELILAGVDIRTVAGRLGHAGGGATTLRTYAAWVSEGDQRAAREIAARMPSRAGPRPLIVDVDPRTAYERIAISLRGEILDGTFLPGLPIPTIKQLAAMYDVSIPTAKRAVDLLSDWRFVQVTPGQRTLVRGLPIDAPDQRSVPIGGNGSGDASPPPRPRPARDQSISKCVTLAEWSTVSDVLSTPTTRQHCTTCLST